MITNKLNIYLLSGLMLFGESACKQVPKSENIARKAVTSLVSNKGKKLNIPLLERYTNGKIRCKDKADSVAYFSDIKKSMDTFGHEMGSLNAQTDSIVNKSEKEYKAVFDSLAGSDPTVAKLEAKCGEGSNGLSPQERKLITRIEDERQVKRESAKKVWRATTTRAWEKFYATRDSLEANVNGRIQEAKRKYAQK